MSINISIDFFFLQRESFLAKSGWRKDVWRMHGLQSAQHYLISCCMLQLPKWVIVFSFFLEFLLITCKAPFCLTVDCCSWSLKEALICWNEDHFPLIKHSFDAEPSPRSPAISHLFCPTVLAPCSLQTNNALSQWEMTDTELRSSRRHLAERDSLLLPFLLPLSISARASGLPKAGSNQKLLLLNSALCLYCFL